MLEHHIQNMRTFAIEKVSNPTSTEMSPSLRTSGSQLNPETFNQKRSLDKEGKGVVNFAKPIQPKRNFTRSTN